MKKWFEEITGKLNAENVCVLSDASIEECFKDCVCANELIKLCKQYRDEGLFTGGLQWDRYPNRKIIMGTPNGA